MKSRQVKYWLISTGDAVADHSKEEPEVNRHPIPTVDIIIEVPKGIVLIRRLYAPHGWAIPGGFVDYGESLEEAAVREATEETGLSVTLVRQFYTYSKPSRDPRHHTISTVFIGRATGVPFGSSDAEAAGIFRPPWPDPLAFDHATILADYLAWTENPSFHPLRWLSPAP